MIWTILTNLNSNMFWYVVMILPHLWPFQFLLVKVLSCGDKHFWICYLFFATVPSDHIALRLKYALKSAFNAILTAKNNDDKNTFFIEYLRWLLLFLTHCRPMFPFNTPWKHPENQRFREKEEIGSEMWTLSKTHEHFW